MTTFILSLIRTYVPIIVGGLVSWFLSLGVEVDVEAQAGLVIALTGFLIAIYYTLVRFLEKKWPVLSVLLGSTQIPAAYTPTGEPPVNAPLAVRNNSP